MHTILIGGGAAGFFAGITCAETFPAAEVSILEKGPQFLAKVRISGGGRCNVTTALMDPKDVSLSYPRGGKQLLGPLHRFGPRESVTWFEDRGVKLKKEPDGRMFPVTDSSQTVIDCLVRSARDAGVRMVTGSGVEAVTSETVTGEARFRLRLTNGESLDCERLVIASGGCRTPALAHLPVSLGHTLAPPVPSLFTFHVAETWLRALSGISVPHVEVKTADANLRQRGPLLATHSGVSGPAILKLSAWGAREFHAANYQFAVFINWYPDLSPESLGAQLDATRKGSPARHVVNTPLAPLPFRLWEALVLQSGVLRETRWADLSRAARHQLIQILTRTELHVMGKTLNQDEFVTCGGIPLKEVDFKTMESRVCPGLYFAGEVLDIDGVTGGFNFQAAWTTGWIAGKSLCL